MAGADPRVVLLDELLHRPSMLAGAQMLVVAGGFSYADSLGAGRMFALRLMHGAGDEVHAFVAAGKPVLGICNGFQVLCESGLLPGALRPNATLSFVCRQVRLEVADTGTPFTAGLSGPLSIPVKNHDGAWYGDPSTARVVLRYHGENPLGAVDAVAGVANDAGNVLGLMPHPEEAVDPLLGSEDGRGLFAALVRP